MQIKSNWILAGGIGLAIGIVVMSGGFQSTPQTTAQQPLTDNAEDISNLQISLKNIQAQIHQQPSNGSVDTNQIQQINQVMMEMQQQIALLKEQIELQQGQPELEYTQSQHSQALSESEQELQHEQRQQQQEGLYAAKIQQEHADPSWSIDAEQKTLDALSQASDKLQVDSIVCKSSLCQLDIARVSGGSDDEALDAFETSLSWEGEMTLTYDPETGQGTVYMARPGHELPRLDEQS